MTKRYFSWKEISRLNKRENLHVAYEGKVYNVSSFVSKHPGGVEQILSGAGRDITQLFKSYHKKDTFKNVLSKYYVGELVDNELPVFLKESHFHSIVKERVERYLKENNLDPKHDNRMFLYYFISVTLYFISLYLIVKFHHIPLCCFIFTLIWGIASTFIGMTLFHDSSHFAITHKPWVWKVAKIISAVITGFSTYIWHYQHVFGHHTYTNIEGADPDIDTGLDASAVWRIKASQRWISRFLYQHVYMPFLYTMLGVKMRIQDIPDIMRLAKDDIRINPLTTTQWIEFWTGKLIHVTLRFIIPLFYMPLFNTVLFNVLFEILSSLYFAQITQLNHVSERVQWPVADEKKQIHTDWAELQVASTQDYCTDSWFWMLFTGALNHQTAHHLFPGFIQSHYRWITPIIRETCEELGVKYNCVDSFLDVLKLHYGFLKVMGSKDNAKNKEHTM